MYGKGKGKFLEMGIAAHNLGKTTISSDKDTDRLFDLDNNVVFKVPFQKSFGVNQANGFWDNKRDIWELLMLIESEIIELLEAHREGRGCQYDDFHDALQVASTKHQEGKTTEEELSNSYIQHFRKHIKDTIQGELTDILIRIWDMMGGLAHLEIEEGVSLHSQAELLR